MRNNDPVSGLQTLAGEVSGRTSDVEKALFLAAKECGMWVSADGRISEMDLGKLLGLTKGTIRNRRREGKMPPHYKMPCAGHRVTYRLHEVASWIESKRRQ